MKTCSNQIYSLVSSLFGVLVIFWCSFELAIAQGTEDLVYITEDYKPYHYEENGEVKGLYVDVLKLVWKRMGLKEQRIHVYPWARGYSLVMNKPNHVLFAMARTKRRENMVKWVGPLTTVRYVLAGLSQAKITVNSIKDAKHYKIGSVRDDAAEQILISQGFEEKNIERHNSHKLNIEKLMLGRIDLIAFDEQAFNVFSTMHPAELETVWVIDEVDLYYAFSQGVSDGVILAFQQAFDSIKTERETFIHKYMSQNN